VLWSVDDSTDTLTAGGEVPASGAVTSMSWTLRSQREWTAVAAVLRAAALAPDAGAADAVGMAPDAALPPDAALVPDATAMAADAAGAMPDGGGTPQPIHPPPDDASNLPDATTANDGAGPGGGDAGPGLATIHLTVGCACRVGPAGRTKGGCPLAILSLLVMYRALRRRVRHALG
jgi:hypothetical protein